MRTYLSIFILMLAGFSHAQVTTFPSNVVVNSKVGIGNSVPLATLSISNNTATVPLFQVFNSNNPVASVTVASNGYVGIGTSDPLYPLDVRGAAGISGESVGATVGLFYDLVVQNNLLIQDGAGVAGDVLTSIDGAGTAKWAAPGAGTVAAPVSSVQFNSNGFLRGSALMTFTNGLLTVANTTKSSNVWDISNVKYWGAVGDGSVDDTISFSNAFRHAHLNGHNVTIPAANSNSYYKITSPLTVYHQARIVGDKDFRADIRFMPAGDNVSCFRVADGADNWSVENVRLYVSSVGTTNVNCIGVIGTVNSRATVKEVDFISATGAGLSVTGGMYYTIEKCYFNANALSLNFRSFLGKCTITDCRSAGDSKFLFAEHASSITILGCTLESGGVTNRSFIEFGESAGVSVIGCFAEANLGTLLSFSNTTSVVISGNHFASDNAGTLYTKTFVSMDGGSVSAFNNTLQNPSNYLFSVTNGILVADRNDYTFNFTNVTACGALLALKSGMVDFSQCRPIYGTSSGGVGVGVNNTNAAGLLDVAGPANSYLFRVNTNLFVVTNGMVGVGTATPGSLFNVYGASPVVRIQDNGAAGTAELAFYDGSTIKGRMRMPPSGAIQFTYQSIDLMTLMPDGTVGIGTTVPSSTLDVPGEVHIGTLIATNLTFTNLNVTTLNASTLNLTNALGSNQVRLAITNLTDVSVPGRSAGDSLFWNPTMFKWTNGQPAGGGSVSGNSNQIPYLNVAGTGFLFNSHDKSAPGFGFQRSANGNIGAMLIHVDKDEDIGLVQIGPPNPAANISTYVPSLSITNRYAGDGQTTQEMVRVNFVDVDSGSSAESFIQTWRSWVSGVPPASTLVSYAAALRKDGQLMVAHGVYYPSNSLSSTMPTAAQLGPGGIWVGNSNASYVTVRSLNGTTTTMTVLVP